MHYPFKIPRWTLEIIILVNVAIFTAIWNDKIIALANETIWTLVSLYFIMLFVWRIISISLFMLNYTFKDLLTPIFALVICGIVLTLIWKINPDYEPVRIENITDKEMAQGVPSAEWNLYIRYWENIYHSRDFRRTSTIRIMGSSENIDEKAKENIDYYFTTRYPNRIYDSHELMLFKLPRHLVQKNRWHSDLYESCKSAESISSYDIGL